MTGAEGSTKTVPDLEKASGEGFYYPDLLEPELADVVGMVGYGLDIDRDDEVIEPAWRIYEAMRNCPSGQLASFPEVYEFDFEVGRGNPDDWESFEEWKDQCEWEGVAPADITEENWLAQWHDVYPQERCGHVLLCVKLFDTLRILIDGELVIEVTREVHDTFESDELIGVMNKLAEMIEAGLGAMEGCVPS